MKIQSIALGIVAILIIAGGLVAVNAGNNNNGNGAPSGHHYTLNILGKDWDNGNYADTDLNPVIRDDNGRRIFVKLGREGAMQKTRILLQEAPIGESFDVIDADGTDGKAIFQLPKPDTIVDDGGTPYDPSDDTVTSANYYAYIRILGKPEGWANMYSGFIDEYGNPWLSLEIIELRQVGGDVNRKSPPKFVDVTKELTTIYVDITNDDIYNPQRYGLFDNALWDYFWDYDNYGLKHVQIRFYDSPQ
jgi:hypothetical protein